MAALQPVSAVDIPASEVMRELTVTVTGFRVMALRWSAAALIFRLAGLVAGCKIVIGVDE